MNNLSCKSICVAVLLAAVSVVQAKPLNLVMQPSPDVTSGFIDVTYDSGLQSLLVQGFSLSFYDGVTTQNINNGTFDINATVDNSGVALSGTISITGFVSGMGPNLLTGNLTAFGHPNAPGDIFEFIFTGTGGDMLPLYGGANAAIGTILDTMNGGAYNGTWTSSWNNNGGQPGFGSGLADTAPPVPEPTTLALLALGGAILIRRRGR